MCVCWLYHYFKGISYRKKFLHQNFWCLGAIERKILLEDECRVISEFYKEQLTEIFSFKRVQRKGEDFHSQSYTRVTRRNSYTVTYGGGKFALIKFYTLHKNKPAAVLQELNILTVPNSFTPTVNIVAVKVTTQIVAISLEDIEDKCILIEIDDSNTYVVKFPCSLTLD